MYKCHCGHPVYPGQTMCRAHAIDAINDGIKHDTVDEITNDDRRLCEFLQMPNQQQRRIMQIAATIDDYVKGVNW